MPRRTLGLLLIVGACGLLGSGGWIHTKAWLAQCLLERSWLAKLDGESQPRPWPWADTWPVAVLEAPGQGARRLVLSGASGRNMAFGPTHLSASAAPGTRSNTVLFGHRDTHFAFLQHLAAGDRLLLTSADGGQHQYTVDDLLVVHEREMWVTEPTDEAQLTLVTCYPFDALIPGGPLRYVVRARRRDPVGP